MCERKYLIDYNSRYFYSGRFFYVFSSLSSSPDHKYSRHTVQSLGFNKEESVIISLSLDILVLRLFTFQFYTGTAMRAQVNISGMQYYTLKCEAYEEDINVRAKALLKEYR